jgi:2-octaprenyl-6-methoxyphenol hydroxylase
MTESGAIVVGGGAAGLATAIGLARRGVPVTLLGLPETIIDDGRSAALFETSLAFLDGIGAGAALRRRGAPLRAIRIVDITDALARAPEVTFRASEIGQEAFGWNIPNAAILDEMIAVAREVPELTLSTARFASVVADARAIAVTDGDGVVHRGAVLVAADGQASPVRAAAGITHREKLYPQVAITVRLAHSEDHLDESLELHTREGPFTFVPVADRECALVWIMQPEKADAMLARAPEDIARIAEKRSFHALGQLTVIGRLGRVPMRRLVADSLVAERVALVGEAAHAFPPIGAQGLNLGLRDVADLVEKLGDPHAAGKDIGATDVLSSYQKARRLDVEARTAGVDILNSALIDNTLPQDLLRFFGLCAMRGISPLRRVAMRLGGGMSALPALRLPDLRPPFLR